MEKGSSDKHKHDDGALVLAIFTYFLLGAATNAYEGINLSI